MDISELAEQMDAATETILADLNAKADQAVADVLDKLDGKAVDDDEEEFDEETMCGVFVDLGSRCGKPITRIAIEPFTPGRFKTECCEECFNSFMRDGYIDGGKTNETKRR